MDSFDFSARGRPLGARPGRGDGAGAHRSVEIGKYRCPLATIEPNCRLFITKPADSERFFGALAERTRTEVTRAPYLEPLGFSAEDGKDFVPGTLTPVWLGFSVYGMIMAYRTDKFGDKGPKTWADFFDVGKFPGRRGLYKGYQGAIEMALLADGVAPDKLYPLDLDRAFKMLDKVKSSVAVWWTSGAQNTQILQSGEVDLSDTWSARAFAAADGGAPVKIVWDGLYSTDGWSIPKGTPRADLARKFIRFCMKPERQGAYCSIVANGPTNLKAYDFIKPERAKFLPTYPANLKNLSPFGEIYWAENNGPIEERFQNWLLGG